MKKTYHDSPAAYVMTFVAVTVAMFLILVSEGHFWGNQVNYLVIMAALGMLLFLGWVSLFITIDTRARTITRRLALFFVSTHNLADVENIRQVSDSDIYGTSKTMQLRFKDGEKWNLGMMSKSDLTELLEVIKKHQQA